MVFNIKVTCVYLSLSGKLKVSQRRPSLQSSDQGRTKVLLVDTGQILNAISDKMAPTLYIAHYMANLKSSIKPGVFNYNIPQGMFGINLIHISW